MRFGGSPRSAAPCLSTSADWLKNTPSTLRIVRVPADALPAVLAGDNNCYAHSEHELSTEPRGDAVPVTAHLVGHCALNAGRALCIDGLRPVPSSTTTRLGGS